MKFGLFNSRQFCWPFATLTVFSRDLMFLSAYREYYHQQIDGGLIFLFVTKVNVNDNTQHLFDLSDVIFKCE